MENKEITKNLFPKWEKQINVFNSLIKVLETIKPLADKFNGKVINNRFKYALENEVGDDNIKFRIKENGYNYEVGFHEKRIAFCTLDRSFQYSASNWGYIEENEVEIYEINAKDFYINADGRLVKDIFIQAIDKAIERLKNKIEGYWDSIDNFDEYLSEVRRINEEIEILRNKMHYPMSLYTFKLEMPFWYK